MTDQSPQPPDNAIPAADPQSVEGLFLQALGQSAQEREAFLDEACGEDAERRRRIEALLRAYDDAGSFLEKPPLGVDTSATLSLEFLASSDDPGLLGLLGPYEVYEMLGRGGMGIVFRARDPKLNRVVAIKVLAPELAANPNARRRFLREAQAAAAISHPHVVTIHAVDEGSTADERNPASSGSRVSSLPFIVMECIVGQTLQQKLDKQGSLRLTEILRIGHQTAQGLAAAHKQGLIHRDIKPANILLENGIERVKITDFGLARAADDVSITRTGEVSGTPQYMSPEQASGGTIDHRSDLFSLGCVLYAMCTGRSPFRATTLAAAIRRVCDDTPRPIEEINPEAPHWLIEIVNRLLAKDSDERIQSAEEVAEVLGDHLAGIQHPPRIRTAEPSRPRAVAQSTSASAAKTARGLGMQVPLRALLWLGAIALLIPIFFAVGGTAIGAGGDALEGAVIAAIICWPIALGLFAVALLDRSLQGNPFANAVFLLVCILLGPIGILLYLVRRDQYLMRDEPAAGSSPPQQVASQQRPDEGESREVPQWLLAPLPGPVKVIAFLLFAAACLVLGQAIEQWSDVSESVGVCLYAAAIPLAVLAIQCALGAGFAFRWPQVVTLGLLGSVLAFLGAQAPDREFKQTLAAESDMVAIFTMGLYLVAIPISLLLWGLSQSGEQGRARRDWLGSAFNWTGVTIWGALVAWMLLVGVGAVPPPPFDASSWIHLPIMLAVMLGGLLLGAGMILRRYVVTPGMVRQFAADKDVRSYEGGAVPAAATSAEATSPWRILGWMLIAGLVIVPGCLTVMLGIPHLTQRSADIGVVQIEFDNARPISWVDARGDIGDAQADQRTIKQPVTRNPFRLPLPAGVYDLTMTWQAEGLASTFVQRVQVEAGRTKQLDVRQNVAMALQPMLDRRPQRDDGFGPMRTIPLGGGKPGTIQFQTGGNIEIGRITVDDQDVPLQQGVSGPGGGLVEVPAEPGHHNIMVVLQSGERYHFGVDVGDDKGAVIQVPPGGEGILQVDFADPSLEIQLRRKQQVAPQPEQMGMGGTDMAYDPFATFTPLDPQTRGGMGGGFGRGMSGFGMGSGQANSVSTSGRYRVASGEYDVWVTDHLAGWCRAGSQQPVSYSYETITIAPGKSQTLTVRRNLKPMVQMHGGLGDFRLYDFRWNGNVETFTRPQAQVIERLFAAYADGGPDVEAKDLLASIDADPFSAEAEVDRTSPESLKVLFDDGRHPAWGTMIVPGEAAESYRLAELRTQESEPSTETPQPEMAVLQFDFNDPGLHVYLHSGNAEHTRRIGPIDDSLENPGRVAIEPGTYTVMVEDDLAGWKTRTKYGEPDAVRYEFDEISLAPGQTLDLTIDRNFYKMESAHLKSGAFGEGKSWFLWNGETLKLDQNQEIAVVRLLRALAEGNGDVHEGALLGALRVTADGIHFDPTSDDEAEAYRNQFAENGQTLKGWFDDGQHPAWERLIVAGERPHTFRLAELRSTSPDEAKDMASLEISVQDRGLHLNLQWKDDNKSRQEGPIDESMTLSLEPGTYTMIVEDDLAGWHTESEFGEPGPVRYDYGQMEVAPRGRREIGVNRNFYKMAAAMPRGLVTGTHRFRWQGASYTLDGKQAPIVAVLLKRYAEGEPEVHEGQLLTGATFTGRNVVPVPMTAREAAERLKRYRDEGHSLKGLFDAGEHPAWGTLIVAGEEPDTYRLATLIEQNVPADPNAAGEMPAQSPQIVDAGTPSVVPPVSTERTVTTNVVMQDDGILAALRRISVFDGKRGAEKTVTGYGGTRFQLQPGDYELLIRDKVFGWGDRIETIAIGDDPTGVEEFVVRRDLAAEAQREVHESHFLWNGEDYFLPLTAERIVVNRLLAAFAAGKPEVAESDLMAPLLEQADELFGEDARETLEQVFDDDAMRQPTKTPAWGSLVVPGETEDTYRLSPIPTGTLTVEIHAPLLFAYVTPEKPTPRFSKRTLHSGASLDVPPGRYRIESYDSGVAWSHTVPGFGDDLPPLPSQIVEVTDGEKTTLTLERDWSQFVEPIPYESGTTDTFRFLWFPGLRFADGSAGKSYELNALQARTISRLLKGLAEDRPEVSNAELIEALGELARPDDAGNTFESLDDVFEGLDDGKWKDLIVRGEGKGTWRLKLPLAPNEQTDRDVLREDGTTDDLSREPGDDTAQFPRGTLKITVADEGLVVGVRRRDKSVFGGFQPAEEQQLSETGQLVLLSGDYQVRVHDELFGWGTWSDRDRQVTVKAEQTQEVTIARDFAELVCEEDIHGLTFHWNGKPYKRFEPQQVALVNRLLKALATDVPAIAEESLVEGYNEAIRDEYQETNIASQLTDKTSLAEVFQGIGLSYGDDSEPIGNISDWQEFVVPGEDEGTWRLATPQAVDRTASDDVPQPKGRLND